MTTLNLYNRLKRNPGKPTKTAYMLILLCTMVAAKVEAQVEPHFSQYYVYPAWLNPALTGAFSGDYRVTGIYRNQWGNVSSPFSTPGLSADFVTGKNINLGASIMNQTVSSVGYNYLNAHVSVAYTGLRFGKDNMQQISFGFSGGILNRKFDPSKFKFGDQWSAATGFDPSNTGSETLSKTSALTFDMGAGMMYYDMNPLKKANLFLGVSAYHLTQPEDPFLSHTSDGKVPVRYTAHGGVKLTLNDRLSIIPNLIYMKQGEAEEKMAGLYAQFRATETTQLLLGANYRFEDAVVPFAGFTYKNYTLGLSYDVTTSTLGKLVNGANSFEISLSFTGHKSGKTPGVDFICPRF
jgi:type IX secretion system PorP/SprF family membrane protein